MTGAALRRLLLGAFGSVFVLASTACLQPSLNPLFEPADARADSRLEGAWACDDAGTRTWAFEKKDDTEKDKAFSYYRIAVKDADTSGNLVALLGRLGAHDFITFSVDGGPDGLPAFVKRQYLSIYTLGRIAIERDRLTLSMMPADWGADRKDDVLFGLGATQGEDGFVLTAPTKALQALVLAHADDPKAFKEALVLVRPGKTGGSCYSEK
jgi:hypothetical protein